MRASDVPPRQANDRVGRSLRRLWWPSDAEPSAIDRPAVTAPLIHIGYHKTATSWLQKRAFSSAALGFALVEPRRLLNEQVAAPHDLDFDADRCRAFFGPRLDEARLAGLVPVLSTERLCGDVLYGAYDSVLIAERLAAAWPEAKVAIVIREQREMVVASYQQYVRAGGQLRFEQYARRPPARGRYLLPFVVPHFEYDRLIGHYRRLFGAERVLVLPFELFRREPARFIRSLTTFAGASPAPNAIEQLPYDEPVNPSWRPCAIAVRRHVNALVRGRLNPWAPFDVRGPVGRTLVRALPAAARAVPRAIDRRIVERMQATLESETLDRYRASNARTSKMTGLDLAAYGYDTGLPAGTSANLLQTGTRASSG